MSTFHTVHPLMFALATAIASPKLLIHVFIGSRLAAIARSGEKMDAGTKAINYVSIAAGAVLGTATGWFIYQRTVARARQLEEEERSSIRQSASRGENNGEFSDDPEEETAAATTLRDDAIDFFDEDEDGDAEGYRDDFIDNEQDVFSHGDEDEEHSIGLNKQHSRK
ncbi:MAG: Tlg2-vesicle protein [Pleopsidium flavum]|nr:MAG: Tlg2-vesicle protein [Pleopsidium flavum]